MNIAALGSGKGTTTEALLRDEEIRPHIKLVVSDRVSNVLLIGKQFSKPSFALHKTETAYVLKDRKIDTVLLLGYKSWIGPEVFEHITTYNLHPSLLPAYGGKGMYGKHVHQAVLNNHEKVSGATLHLVNLDYDKGDIIEQIRVPVYKTDTIATLEDRVHKAEVGLLIWFLHTRIKDEVRHCSN